MLEEDRRIDQDALVLKGIDYYSTVGRKLRSALQIDTTDEDKLSKLIEQAILAGLLIDSQSRWQTQSSNNLYSSPCPRQDW